MSYKRILLKLSGETLGGADGVGLDSEVMGGFAAQVAAVAKSGTQIAIVIGGGNIFRGLSGVTDGFDRVRGDQMGMLATVINSIGFSLSLRRQGVKADVFTATPMRPIAKYYMRDEVLEYMESGGIALVAGGTGNPFFTTDSGAALRACELHCDALFKGTKVDGVYDSDPKKNSSAKKFETISFDEAIRRELHVMDQTAFTLCKENDVPIVVFNINEEGMLAKVVEGGGVCSTVKNV